MGTKSVGTLLPVSLLEDRQLCDRAPSMFGCLIEGSKLPLAIEYASDLCPARMQTPKQVSSDRVGLS